LKGGYEKRLGPRLRGDERMGMSLSL
jgi:hypothetical protein